MRHSVPTGQWFTSNSESPWWFDSGSVAVDFAHTGGFADEPELFPDASKLGEWLAARYPEVGASATDRDLVDAAALRTAVAAATRAAAEDSKPAAADVDVINLFAATPDIPPALDGGTRQAGRSRARTGQALAAIARETIDLLTDDDYARIRECAADDCDLVFYDESRSNNRRWCSMHRCGNRAKVRTHRARHLADQP